MYFIVFDLEFNQDPDSLIIPRLRPDSPEMAGKYPYEIIQIGAVKLDGDFKMVGTFNRLVRPSIYGHVSDFVIRILYPLTV